MFEDLDVVHVGDELLRFLAKLVDLPRLFQVQARDSAVHGVVPSFSGTL